MFPVGVAAASGARVGVAAAGAAVVAAAEAAIVVFLDMSNVDISDLWGCPSPASKAKVTHARSPFGNGQ